MLHVPNTMNCVLLNDLIKAEQKLVLVSGYNVKLVEQSGIPLARIFQGLSGSSTRTCHWSLCPVCTEFTGKGKSGCRLSNLVYVGECIECLEQVEAGNKKATDVGRYVGESGRTLAERSTEHLRGAKSFDPDNFIIKHLVIHHNELEDRPRIKFMAKKAFNDPLSRLVAESVYIDKLSNLNSKSEWRKNEVSPLVVETPEWMKKKNYKKSSPTTDKKLGVEDDLTEQVESLKTRKDVAVRERKKERRNVLLDGEDHFDECTTCIIKQVKRLFTNTAGEEEGKER